MRETKLRQYVVDAFTDHVFAGNPAAVCILEHWLPDDLILNITRENNLSETAFAVRENGHYRLRWFTPGGEIDLCGHATLATAYVISRFIEPGCTSIAFETLSGELTVTKRGNLFEMDFPAYELTPVSVTQAMTDALGAKPIEAYMGRDLLCVFDDERTVYNIKADQERVKDLDGLLLHVTAKGSDFDCVSRSFGPKCNIPEDPVCGSGHCHILPYWSKRLHKTELVAYQASARGGVLHGTLTDGRVLISGEAALFSEALIHIG